MKDKDSTRLQHMLDYAREAKAMATGHQRLDLDSDRTLMFSFPSLFSHLKVRKYSQLIICNLI
jgi:hypothetical protein